MTTAELTRRERQRAETRAELLAAAHELVRKEGYEGLTIRKLAEKVGYAPMSVYSYFADKQAILTAVAEDTFAMLARRIQERQPEDPIEALRAGMREYAAFGLENPNEYRTIFMTEKLHLDHEETFEELESKNPAFIGLLNCVKDCLEAGHFHGDARAISTFVWTVTHGAVSLLLTFPKYPFGEPLDYVSRMVDLTIDALKRGNVEPLGESAASC